MNQQHCPGLLADRPHQWLAAIGATVLVDDLRSHGPTTPAPAAVLHSPHNTLPKALQTAWPTRQDFAAIPIVAWNLTNNKPSPSPTTGA